MRQLSPAQRAIALLFTGAVLSAWAIAIDDTNAPGYITGNDNFTGVVKILFNDPSGGTFICSGSLISSVHILTAGHCVDDASNWMVTFETPGGTTTLGTSGASLHPLFGARPAPIDGLDEYDLGILTLASAAPGDAAIYGLNADLDGVFTNSIIDLVGYGLGGNPLVGYLGTGVRRHAVNTIDFLLGSLNGVPTPDDPFVMQHNFANSLNSGSTMGLINGGDSGGPALFNGQIVGVASFGNLPRPPDAFGDFDYFTGHATLFHDSTTAWIASIVVPEPGTWVMLLGGMAAIALFKRRRPEQ